MARSRYRPLLFVLGSIILAIGVYLLLDPEITSAQEEISRTYIGSRECRSCHRTIGSAHSQNPHAQTLITPDGEFPILADFSINEEIRTIQFPGEDAPRSIVSSDIAYQIGAGRNLQQFVTQLDSGEYQVLPVQWNVHEGRWEPYHPGENWPGDEYDWVSQCAYCHTTNFDTSSGEWEEDGVQCEACHGPGSIHLEIVEDIRDVPSVRQRRELEASIEIGLDPQICGKCHSQGNDPHSDSPYPTTYEPRSELTSEDIFALVGTDDPAYWWQTGQASQPNMQFNEWILSGHASSFEALVDNESFSPGCLSCHNVTYGRAARTLAQIEANNDEDVLEILLLDDADLDIDIDELPDALIAALGIDPGTIDANSAFLPQTLPYLIKHLLEEDLLTDTTVLSQQLAAVIEVATSGNEYNMLSYGVTCASCHSPHSPESEQEASELSYSLCTECHRNSANSAGTHHPVQELFEGQVIVPEVTGIVGGHFGSENGPTCVTCHMTSPIENDTRSSHLMKPIMPGDVASLVVLQDSCSECHGELVDQDGLQSLIDAIQSNTDDRIAQIKDLLDENTHSWVTVVVASIEGDGSHGIHNFTYVDALLSAAEQELGLQGEFRGISLPEIAHTLPIAEEADADPNHTTRLSLPSILLLIIVIGILGYSAYAFFFREDPS